jgi:hypothetical protein
MTLSANLTAFSHNSIGELFPQFLNVGDDEIHVKYP